MIYFALTCCISSGPICGRRRLVERKRVLAALFEDLRVVGSS